MADGFERALQALQQQTWIAKRAAQLVKEGRDSLAAMTQANDEWNQKCQTGEVLATEMEYMRQYSRLKPYSLTHGEASSCFTSWSSSGELPPRVPEESPARAACRVGHRPSRFRRLG